MNEQPAWQWNEIQHVGTDFADAAEVERYERRMGEFRDLAAEDAAILAPSRCRPTRASWRSAPARAISPGGRPPRAIASRPSTFRRPCWNTPKIGETRRIDQHRVPPRRLPHVLGPAGNLRRRRLGRRAASLARFLESRRAAKCPPHVEARRAIRLARRRLSLGCRQLPSPASRLSSTACPRACASGHRPRRQRIQHARLDHGRLVDPGRFRYSSDRRRPCPADSVSLQSDLESSPNPPRRIPGEPCD